ncbi:hypothetical protein [Crocosphaera chwakensis]|uniref:Uncharacterized protein n=1 Tax=Crocosphaera chwakensis CCY0110 TaxID=391612 RepID=A3IMU9_9CHRO|nr:hypothetical protein [Crocosphaera chwakensis]EAZ92202.1 hypothetical protein CY0110_24866 [Crocosphaera chwakensis CCY0110]
MNMFNTLAQFSQIAIGSLTLGISTLVFIIPVEAQTEIITDPKPLETYTGSLQDLEGTESRTRDESLAVGGEYPRNVEIPSLETDKNSLEAKTEALNEVLEDHDYNLGDVKRPTYRVPFVHF